MDRTEQAAQLIPRKLRETEPGRQLTEGNTMTTETKPSAAPVVYDAGNEAHVKESTMLWKAAYQKGRTNKKAGTKIAHSKFELEIGEALHLAANPNSQKVAKAAFREMCEKFVADGILSKGQKDRMRTNVYAMVFGFGDDPETLIERDENGGVSAEKTTAAILAIAKTQQAFQRHCQDDPTDAEIQKAADEALDKAVRNIGAAHGITDTDAIRAKVAKIVDAALAPVEAPVETPAPDPAPIDLADVELPTDAELMHLATEAE